MTQPWSSGGEGVVPLLRVRCILGFSVGPNSDLSHTHPFVWESTRTSTRPSFHPCMHRRCMPVSQFLHA